MLTILTDSKAATHQEERWHHCQCRCAELGLSPRPGGRSGSESVEPESLDGTGIALLRAPSIHSLTIIPVRHFPAALLHGFALFTSSDLLEAITPILRASDSD